MTEEEESVQILGFLPKLFPLFLSHSLVMELFPCEKKKILFSIYVEEAVEDALTNEWTHSIFPFLF